VIAALSYLDRRQVDCSLVGTRVLSPAVADTQWLSEPVMPIEGVERVSRPCR
jgi:hypothetical protein